MRKKVKQWMSGFLVTGLVFGNIIPAQAYTTPQEAEAQLQSGYAKEADAYAIYPVPQHLTYETGEFVISDTVNVVLEEGIDSYTGQFLEEVLTDYGRSVQISEEVVSGKSNILMGVEGSEGIVSQWVEEHSQIEDPELFTRTDAYLLEAKDGTIAILGRDTDAAYCAVATLQMMFSSFAGEKFLNARIEDYAVMAVRGFIEGFYGGWDYGNRESLMRFARDFKMNTYVYASKTDAYHKNDSLYPEAEINQIADLVKVGQETKVQYAWSIHISYFFNRLKNMTVGSDAYNTAFEENYKKLLAKLEQLYDVGVRKFDILNDDFGAGSHSEVVRLLNRLDEEFLQPKGCERMSYCPQGYNQAWSGDGSELEVLKSLSGNIDIYWTGSDVNSPITQETVNFLKSKTNHDPVFWLNYPVNEHGASGVYLGNITHYARDGVTGLAGAVSNPSRFAQTNKAGLFQLASLFWNNKGYTKRADEIWEEAFKYLQPEVYDAYLTIARNVSNCPGSGRVPAGFPESEYLKDTLDQVSESLARGEELAENEKTAVLLQEFAHIQEAVEQFRSNCDNQALVTELDPWLSSLHDIAMAGEAALRSVKAVQAEDADEAWRELGTASKAMDTQNTYPTFSGSDKMALAGSRYLAPFVSKTVTMAKNLLTPYLDPSSQEFTPSFYAMLGGQVIGDGSESSKVFDGDAATYGGFTKVQEKGDYFGVDMGRVLPVHSISILQGKTDADHDYFHNGCLEYSKDGENWTTIAQNVDAHKMKVTGILISARYIRLRLTEKGTPSKPDYWTYIREFAVNQNQEEDFGAISSREELKNHPVVMEDKTYTLGEIKNAVLAPGEYLGIKLKELAGIESLDCQAGTGMEGMALEYSENGVIWSPAPDQMNGESARYVRIFNGTGNQAKFDLKKLAVTVTSVSIHPAVTESSFANLKEGSWENLFDGNTATYAWTNTPQKNGQYILVDLGATAPVYDLQITTEDGNPRFYNAKIQISTDKENWEDVAEVVDGGKDAVRENIFYRITKNLNGKQARYLKILITGDSGYYLKICDIDINKSVQEGSSEIRGNIQADLGKMIDGNISTVSAAREASDGTAYVEYKITERTRMNSVTFLQDSSEITGAQVEASIFDGKKTTIRQLGILDAGSRTFSLNPEEDVLSLRITWPEGKVPVIYEIITNSVREGESGGEESTFPQEKQVYKLGQESFSAVTTPYGTALSELSLPESISVTYTDGTQETRNLVWKGEDYRPYQAGTYVLEGYPVMPEGVYNHAGLYAQLQVTVEEKKGGDEDQYPDVTDGNLALSCPVSESGSGLHPVEEAVDGDMETRWEGNAIKGGSAVSTSWICVDLGPDKTIRAEQVNVKFYLKTFATDYDLQVSDDGNDWITIKTQKHANSDEKDMADQFTLAEPITQRYVRLFFRSMNANAAGHAVGIRELEVLGSRSSGNTPAPECTCRMEGLEFADIAIRIPADAASAETSLSAAARITGNCQVEGHQGKTIAYDYRIARDSGNIGSISGNTLTVTEAGTLQVEVTAEIPGSEAEPVKKTAAVTVTKEERPVPECTCRMEGLEFADIAIRIPADAASAETSLSAAARIMGDCQVEGHQGKTIAYAYRIAQDNDGIGSISGNVLTVTKAGSLCVEVTAQIPESSAAPVKKTASVTVTKEQKNVPVTKPEAPGNLNASKNKTTSIRLAWKSVEGAQGYILSRYDNGKNTWKDIKNTTSLSFTDKKLKAATVYQYRVRAYKKSGSTAIEGLSGNIVKTATAPAKTKLKVKRAGKGKVKLTWNRKAKADGFELRMKTGKGSYKHLVNKGKKATFYKKAGLKKGKVYRFQLRSYKKAGGKKIYSAYSAEQKIKW